MAEYHVPTVDLSTRIQLVAEMLLPVSERGWGRATQLAEEHGISRTRLYELRNEARALLATALEPQAPGPKVFESKVTIDRHFIQQVIATLPLVTGSVRGIQTALQLLFGVNRSIGYISETLQEAGQRAMVYNKSIRIPQSILAEADEIFQGRRPCLTVVDGRSFLVLNLSPAEARDETHWGVTFLELAEQGVQFQDVAADGARGIRAGLAAAELAVPLRPDLFHLLRDAHPITKRLERAAYKAMETTEQSRRVEQEAAMDKRRQGRPCKANLLLAAAVGQEEQAIDTFDLWCWLLGEVRQALEPITPAGHLSNSLQVHETIQVATMLMRELARQDVGHFADKVMAHLDELLAPIEWLETTLARWRTSLSSADEAFITWFWQQQQALDLPLDEAVPAHLLDVAQAFWHALALFHRASSLAESLHSWVRPHLQAHRGLPQWLGPLLQLFWNHHRFQRGKRSGYTPLELAGVDEEPSLAQVLAGLFVDHDSKPALS
ncbi:MAG: hypothetical protein WBF55_07210 [Syntrophobacteria bacterium]